MKLRHIVIVALALVGLYVASHYLFSHGGMAKVQGSLGGLSAGANAGFGR